MIIDNTLPDVNTITNRLLYSQNNSSNGITVVCICSMHGNEPAGFFGLQKVITTITDKKITFNGNLYALIGNIDALKNSVRFHDLDLNRLWTKQDIEILKKGNHLPKKEYQEQLALYNEIRAIISRHNGPFVFLDLHTTSSPTMPFITISDSLNNRSLANRFNLPIVLGIEEYIEGPLLTYINEFGHTSLGFEAGQHQDHKSAVHCEAFVWLILEQLGLVTKETIAHNNYINLLNFERHFFEIIHRHSLTNLDDFEVISGFENFDLINKNQNLAFQKSKPIKSVYDGFIFMPLYQKQGNDGFFIVKKISKIWLLLSIVFRKLKLHKLLSFFPGIKRHPENEYCLIANKRIAFFLTTKVFHLFGYRKKIIVEDKIHFIKRDRKVSEFI